MLRATARSANALAGVIDADGRGRCRCLESVGVDVGAGALMDVGTVLPHVGIWCVRQDRSYEQDRASGLIFGGSAPSRHVDEDGVGCMGVGDVVLHCARGGLVALGEVVTAPATGSAGLDGPRDAGRPLRVEYFPLAVPIPISEVPNRDAGAGPFSDMGGAGDGLFPVAAGWASALRAEFAQRWPPGSPWAGGQRRFWLFQCNPKQWDLTAHLPQLPPGAIEDWTASRHRALMQPGDGVVLWQSGVRTGAYATAHLVGVPRLRPRPDFRPAGVIRRSGAST